jgi:hypothetical protein
MNPKFKKFLLIKLIASIIFFFIILAFFYFVVYRSMSAVNSALG